MAKGSTVRMWQRSLIVLVALVLVGFGIIVVRLVQLQIIQGEDLQRRAVAQQLADDSISAQRGTIYDCNMRPLAQSASVWKVIIVPAYLQADIKENMTQLEKEAEEQKAQENREMIASRLAEILDMEQSVILEKATGKTYYVILKKDIESDVKDEIIAFKEELAQNKETKDLVGSIYLEPDYKRYYPYGNFAASVLGFTSEDDRGLAGLELEYNSELTGVPGRLVTARNGVGTDMPYDYDQMVPAQDGNSLVLSIDETIQHYMEKYLEQGIADNLVKNRGVAVMMDVNTGAILGMAVKEDYDPNNPRVLVNEEKAAEIEALPEEDQQQALVEALGAQWRNKAVSDNYEPGSVFKIITASMALEENVCTLDTPFYCSGALKVEGVPTPVKCHKTIGHGAETFQEALWNSCNPAFGTIGKMLGADKFTEYYYNFGFGQKTGIDLPDEATGIYYANNELKEIDLVISSFGQGHTDTPMQMLTAVAAVANGGKLVTPHVVSKILDSDGNIVKTIGTEVKRQVISKETSDIMRDILEQNAVTGSGKNGYIAGYRIAGKTGTSEKKAEQAVTGEENYIASYCGFAPADDPKVALLVFYDTPKGDNYYGSAVAAPTFRNIMNDVLPYLGVERKYNDEELAKLDIKTTPDVTGKTLSEAQNAIQQEGLQYKVVGAGDTVLSQIPEAGKVIPGSGTVVLYTDEESSAQTVTVPDLRNLTPSQVNQRAQEVGLNVRLSGSDLESAGVMSQSQSIEAGSEVSPGTIIEVGFITEDNIR